MQKQQTSGLYYASKDYVSIVDRVCSKVSGFSELYQKLKRSISINGMSESSLVNYSRQLTHLALHYDFMPLDPSPDQVMDYLYLVKAAAQPLSLFSTLPCMACGTPVKCAVWSTNFFLYLS